MRDDDGRIVKRQFFIQCTAGEMAGRAIFNENWLYLCFKINTVFFKRRYICC